MVSPATLPEAASQETKISSRNRDLLVLVLLLAFTALKGLLWISLIAPLDAPDEPSHFNYVVQVREGFRLPVVVLVSPAGLLTPPSTPLNGDLRDWFAKYDYKFFRSMPYESTQPPLYYWAASFLTRFIPVNAGNFPLLLTASRIVSVLFGVGSVAALWLASLWVWPGAPWLRIAAPLALTLSPEFSFLTAVVSNDAGMVFAGAVILALWACGLRYRSAHEAISTKWLLIFAALSGLFTAAGVLTKLTFAATVPVTILWLYWLSRRGDDSRRLVLIRWACAVALCGVLAAIPVLPWLLRNIAVYGEPTGSRAIFDLYHSIYWQREGLAASQLFSGFDPVDFAARAWRSFWAVFGWSTVSLDGWVYWLLVLPLLLALLGLFRRAGAERLPEEVRRLAVMMAVVLGLSFVNFVGYSALVDYQPQARYIFVALDGSIFLLVLGLGRLQWPGGRRLALSVFLFMLACVHIASLFVLSAHTQGVLAAVQK